MHRDREQGAAESKHVKEEIEAFLTTGRSIIPIEFGGDARQAPWWELLEGSKWETEPKAALATGVLSPECLQRITGACTFSTRERRLGLTAKWLIAVVSGLLLMTGGASWLAKTKVEEAAIASREAAVARDQATTMKGEAEKQKGLANEATALAVSMTNEATTANNEATKARRRLETAHSDLQLAKVTNSELAKTVQSRQTELAATTTKLQGANLELAKQVQATEATQRQQEAAAKAQKEAETLRDRAVTQALEADASRIDAVSGNAKDLRLAVLDSLNNYTRMKPYIKTVPASLQVALADATVLARKHGRTFGINGYPRVVDFDVAPSRNLVVTCGTHRPTSNRGDEEDAVALWNVAAGEVLTEVERSKSAIATCAFSPDHRRLVVGDLDGGLRVYTFSSGQVTLAWSKSMPWPIIRARFAPGGQRLVVWTGDELWRGDNLYLLDASNGDATALELPEGIHQFVTSVRFSEATLVATALASPVFGTMEYTRNSRTGKPEWGLTEIRSNTGKVRKWDLSQPRILEATGKEGFSPFSASVLSPSGRWVAIVPQTDDPVQKHSFVIDLECVADPRRRCKAVHILAAPQNLNHGEVELGVSPGEDYLLIRNTLRSARVYRLSAIEK